MIMINAKDFWNDACRTEDTKSPADIMIEFAKLHVEEALKGIKNQSELWDDFVVVPYEKIKYSLDNIK